MLDTAKRRIFTDVLDNKTQYLVLVFFLVMGITAGTFTVSNLSGGDKDALESYRNALFVSVQTVKPDFWSIFFHALLYHTLLFGVMSAFSLMIMGIPVILILMIFKGFCVGFTVGVLSLNMGMGGFFAIIFCVLLPNLVLIPCVCKAGVLGINNAVTVFKNRHIPQTSRDKIIASQPFFKKMFSVYAFGLLGVLIETLLSPSLLGLVSLS